MATIKFDGKEYILPGAKDNILELKDDVLTVECQVKGKKRVSDTATYPHFLTYNALLRDKGKENVRIEYNRRTRTLAVNGENRSTKTPNEIKALKDARTILDASKQAAMDKDILAVIAKYAQAEASKAA